MKIIGIIPARYQSSRFPGKPLALILGKPLVIHVCEKVEIALGIENTYVATDDDRIATAVETAGYKTIMTSSVALTGTDRLWEAAQQIKADIYVNVQGDEPMINPDDILKIVAAKKNNPNMVVNGMYPLSAGEDCNDINIPKVVVNKSNRLVYMSRLPIPGIKSPKDRQPAYMKQVCIYAFNKEELRQFGVQTQKAEFERHEDIEILRYLDLDIPVLMVQTSKVSLAVDNPEDVGKVEKAMQKTEVIFFDFDGVILDSMEVRELGFRSIFKDFSAAQVELLITYHRKNGGLSRYVKIRYFFEEIKKERITEDGVQLWANKYSEIMRESLTSKQNLISETVEFIKRKFKSYKLHIVSGSDGKELNFLCEKLGIQEYFLTIDGSPTPKIELVKNILNKYQYDPNGCVLIGDSINDYDAAKANNITFYGYNNDDLRNKGVRYIESFENLNDF